MSESGARESARPRGGLPQLGAIARETVQDRVYRELRRALIYGLFAPGQVLGIQDLADSFGTSTMPVRDALGRLVSEQALEATANRSARVPPIDPDRLDDLLRARVLIEGAAVELAAPRLTAADFAALRRQTAEFDRVVAEGGLERIEAELEANRAFHFHIYQAAGSAVLMPIIESLWLQSGPCVRAAALAFASGGPYSTLHFHAEIIDALEKGDVAGARAALARDIGRAFGLLRKEAEP